LLPKAEDGGWRVFLLYRYRQERGASRLCNFGRFHPRYRKSTNRKENKRGGKLETDQKNNPSGGPSHPLLRAAGKPGEPDWMGLSWSGFDMMVPEKTLTAPQGPGLFVLIDAGSQEICYIGQSGNCAKRLLDHAKKSWDEKDLRFSCHLLERPVLPHQLKEMENDLIGNYFEHYRKAPEYQFRNSRLCILFDLTIGEAHAAGAQPPGASDPPTLQQELVSQIKNFFRGIFR